MDELERLRRQRMEELKRRLEYPEGIIDISRENLTEILRKFSFVVIDCWAGWCVPCKILEPRIIELSEEYSGRVVFGKLNVDENMEVARNFDIKSIPTLLFFKNGKLVHRTIGVVSKDEVRCKLNEILENGE